MIDIDKMNTILEKRLKPKRYQHSLGVMKSAVELAEHYGCDIEKAKVAGLLHDFAKSLPDEQYIDMAKEYGLELSNVSLQSPKILHGVIAAEMLRREYGLDDEDIYHAIKVHTTGCLNMSLLDKIIYVADYIEENRDPNDIEELYELRKLAFEDINEAVILGINISTKFLIEKDKCIDTESILERNRLILERGK